MTKLATVVFTSLSQFRYDRNTANQYLFKTRVQISAGPPSALAYCWKESNQAFRGRGYRPPGFPVFLLVFMMGPNWDRLGTVEKRRDQAWLT